MGVWLFNFTPVPTRQNLFLFLITQSGVKTIEYFHCTCRITNRKRILVEQEHWANIRKDGAEFFGVIVMSQTRPIFEKSVGPGLSIVPPFFFSAGTSQRK